MFVRDDIHAAQFDAKGEISQIEYANFAVQNTGYRCIGVTCKNGFALITATNADKNNQIPLNSEKNMATRILKSSINGRINKVDEGIITSMNGISSDCRHLLTAMRAVASDYRSRYGTPITLTILVEELSTYLHERTLLSDTRPLAVCALIASSTISFDNDYFSISQKSSNNDTVSSTEETKKSSYQQSSDMDTSINSRLVKLECDGSYDYYSACVTKTNDITEDLILEKALKSVNWGVLSVNDATFIIKEILHSLNIIEKTDNETEDILTNSKFDSENQEEDVIKWSCTLIQPNESYSDSSLNMSTFLSKKGNRSHRFIQYALSHAANNITYSDVNLLI